MVLQVSAPFPGVPSTGTRTVGTGVHGILGICSSKGGKALVEIIPGKTDRALPERKKVQPLNKPSELCQQQERKKYPSNAQWSLFIFQPTLHAARSDGFEQLISSGWGEKNKNKNQNAKEKASVQESVAK